MSYILVALCVLLFGGALALAAGRSRTAATWIGAGSAVVACAVGLGPALAATLGGPTQRFELPTSMPLFRLELQLDALSGFFLIPIFVLAGAAAIYGVRYTLDAHEHRALGAHWLFYDVLLAAMVVTVVAHDGLLFLLAWEVMALASFLLVMFDGDRAEVRRAGWIYLTATHVGTAALIAMFGIAGSHAGSLGFDALAGAAGGPAGLLFILALIGFGTKAGFVPLHVWLPEAHPAAPSHVSAVMSGVMIKTGIYALIRFVSFLGAPPAWWGVTLIAVGLTSGVLGVLFALAQHDLKRLLAYHSVENVGIIVLGLGVGLLGVSAGAPVVALLGLAGGLLHVLNHALFKGLLFLGAGAVAHATGTRELDRLGGLGRRMPQTALAFAVGAAAISGLPPLNGFVSELLIYVAAFAGVGLTVAVAVPSLALVAGLALIGGLAAACFAKAFGVVFLGTPRDPAAREATEVPRSMRWPMLALAAACVAIPLAGPWLPEALLPAVRVALGGAGLGAIPPDVLATARGLLTATAIAGAALVATAALLALLRHALLHGHDVRRGPTWDCGYAAPNARMQYTASSFAQPLVGLFAFVLRPRRHETLCGGRLPRPASLTTHTPDLFMDGLFRPLLARSLRLLEPLRILQHGRVHLYVLYILAAIVVLLLLEL